MKRGVGGERKIKNNYGKRKSASARGSSKWQTEAKQKIVKWRQQLSKARALAHGEIVVEVAARKDIKISTDESGLSRVYLLSRD